MKKLNSNIWFPHLGLKLIRFCVFAFFYFCFGFNLLLSRACFCVPLHRIFISNSFCFCIKWCLFTYFSFNFCVWTCFTLAYLRTMVLIWPSFYFIKLSNLCESIVYIMCDVLFKIVWIWISMNLSASACHIFPIFFWYNCILIAQEEWIFGPATWFFSLALSIPWPQLLKRNFYIKPGNFVQMPGTVLVATVFS